MLRVCGLWKRHAAPPLEPPSSSCLLPVSPTVTPNGKPGGGGDPATFLQVGLLGGAKEDHPAQSLVNATTMREVPIG